MTKAPNKITKTLHLKWEGNMKILNISDAKITLNCAAVVKKKREISAYFLLIIYRFINSA